MENAQITDILGELEHALLPAPEAKDPAIVSQIIADEFREIGSSGRLYFRSEVIRHVCMPSDRRITIDLLSAVMAGPDTALVTYRTTNESDGTTIRTLRSSLWIFRDDRWQIIFHQGTPQGPVL